jgi:hypothetical protein
MASILLNDRQAHFSPSYAREDGMRRHELEMKKLVRDLVVVVILGVFSVGALAQKQGQGQDKRPPKEKETVVTNDKKNDRPPQNNNQPKPSGKKKP